MDACARYGRWYVASTDAAIWPGEGGPPRSASTVVSAAAERRKAGRSPGSGRVGRRSQVASAHSLPAARSATSSRSAITPRKLPSRTTVSTPGRASAAAGSRAASVAPREGGRTIRP